LASQRDRGGEADIPGWTAFKTFDLGEQFGDVKHLTLRYQLVLVHVAQAPRSVTGNIHAVRPGGKWHPETSVTCRERFSIEIMVGCHVQPLKID